MAASRSKPQQFREMFEGPSRLFPELPELLFMGRGVFYDASVGLGQHTHVGMEICYIERGRVRWWAEKKSYDVSGGQVYIAWPGEKHGGANDVLEPCKLFWMSLDLWPGGRKGKRSFLGLPPVEAKILVESLRSLPQRCFAGPQSLAAGYTKIAELIKRPRHPLATVELRAALLEILVTVIRSGHARQGGSNSLMVSEAILLMERTLDEPLPLPLLAKKMGWSTTHFKVRFRKETGVPPAEFYLRRRMEEACQRLKKTQQAVTEIGLDLGFSSSQNFATAFKRIIGVTPRRFRASSLIPVQATRKHGN
jgi:AraC-like DNA-binding protein/quercetin dioxygenase-like cupin family protein